MNGAEHDPRDSTDVPHGDKVTKTMLSEDLYRQPEGDAFCGTLWFWMDGEISKEGISADLKAMGEKKVKKALIFTVSNHAEKPTSSVVPFMSQEWIDLFVHAVREADRYGVEIGLHRGPGWAGSGGPWITPEHSMQVLRLSQTFVSGNGQEQEIALPKPRTNLGYYQDARVIAYPSVKTMQSENARLTASQELTREQEKLLTDGNSDVFVPLDPVAKGGSRYLEISFEEPQKVYGIRLTHSTPEYSRNVELNNYTCSAGKLQVKDNSGIFRDIGRFELGGYGEFNLGLIGEACSPSTGNKFRIVFDKSEGNVFKIGEVELIFEPVLSNWMKKAGHYTNEVGTPNIYEWEPNQTEVRATLKLGDVKDLTNKMSANGVLKWDVPEGNWTVCRIGHTTSGIAPRPLPHGMLGESLETDKLAAEATQLHYRKYAGRLAEACGDLAGKAFTFLEIDSWEVGAQNWTRKLLEEFQKRRGYDLAPYLPLILTGRIVGSQEASERFLEDFRHTLLELLNENYFNTYKTLCHEDGLQLWAEAYHTMFADALDVAPNVDVFMSEFWGNHLHDLTIFSPQAMQAQSAAQTYGIKQVPAEAFTSHLDRWKLSPKEMKGLGDLMYTQGINRFLFHRYAHQPWLDRVPGMTMGPNGVHFERTNTWWNQSMPWLNYLARCQDLLQRGKGTGDVVFIQPEFMPTTMTYVVHMYRMAKEKLEPGYGRIYMTQKGLTTQATAGSRGTIELPLGTGYSVIVLPDYEEASEAFLEKVWELVNAGAVAVASVKPSRAPGLNAEHNARVVQVANQLFGDLDGNERKIRRIGKGMLTLGLSLKEVLDMQELEKDFDYVRLDETIEPPNTKWASIREINFIHRVINGEDVYFIANKTKHPQNVMASFRVQSGLPEIYDPLTTEVLSPAFWKRHGDVIKMPLTLDPDQSVFVSFRKKKDLPVVKSLRRDGKEVFEVKDHEGASESNQANPDKLNLFYNAQKTLKLETTVPGDYEILFDDGKEICRHVNVDSPLILDTSWQVQFVSDRGAPQGEVLFPSLEDWSKHSHEGIQYYSGTAIYRTSFTSPEKWFDDMRKFVLDLGEVDVIADVKINGKNLGTLWYAPFVVDVTNAIKPGKNVIEVTVSNLWTNRIIGDLRNPDNEPYTYSKTQLYKPEDNLEPSGLLGPVKITPVASIPIGE